MEVSSTGNSGILIENLIPMATGSDQIKLELKPKSNHEDFVRQYIETRKKEKRFYSNEEVMQLPDLPVSHTLFKEWQLRKKSAAMLRDFCQKKKGPIKILEVGCGNGWLSAYLATIPLSEVTGIDINYVELGQAQEVFNQKKNLRFICTDLSETNIPGHPFDIIVFAASIQYFASINTVIKSAQSLLSSNGEIHIIDSHFYKATEVDAASRRTARYYSSLGFGDMSKYYFHHSLSDLSPFDYSVLFAPSLLQKILFRNPYPFYWIKIKGKG